LARIQAGDDQALAAIYDLPSSCAEPMCSMLRDFQKIAEYLHLV
jgi:hypothetical protein